MAKVGKAPLLALHTAAVRRALPFALKERCKNAFKEGDQFVTTIEDNQQKQGRKALLLFCLVVLAQSCRSKATQI
jgi:hypothetical protein